MKKYLTPTAFVISVISFGMSIAFLGQAANFSNWINQGMAASWFLLSGIAVIVSIIKLPKQ